MIYLFLVSMGFIAYTYAVFPLLLHLRARSQPVLSTVVPEHWPSVSIVIPTCNEARFLPARLNNLAALDYPASKVEWIFVSNGSTDGTEAWLHSAFFGYPDRKYLHLATPVGKSSAIKQGVALASGRIIVFMDARLPVSGNALKKLVPYLQYPEVGAVSGELVLSDPTSLAAGNFGLYWRYEKWIRENESRLYSTTGVTGALYAIRRRDFKPNRNATLLDEFDTPVRLLKQGKRTLFVAGAHAYDKASDNIRQEFQKKVRNLAGNWQSFQANPWLFQPSRNPVWWQFLSHKLFRLLVPYALITAFVSALLGEGTFLDIMFALQWIFYVLVAASYLNMPGTGNRVMNLLKVIVQLNAAALMATLHHLKGQQPPGRGRSG
ncbi:glycosyltransferase [Granulosicoccus sp. 3-233]|uniref:glycosyltransferase n=1 Tax=Granulosicoccus sp. 3-233 TaxID=3417969 RepID=UPI003D3371C1